MKRFIKVLVCIALAVLLAFPAACKPPQTGNSTSDSASTSAPESTKPNTPSNEPQYSIDQTVQKLASSVYADNTLTDDQTYGLSDISEVGVIESDMGEELYPIDDTDCAIIDYQTVSDADNDYDKLLDAFEKAKEYNQNGQKAIIDLPENGELLINSSRSNHNTYTYNLIDYNGLYVRGNGCKITLTYNNFGFRGFARVDKSKDIHFNDIVIDYQIPTAINGLITDINKDKLTVTVQIDKSFNETVKRAVAANAKIQSYVEFDAITLAPKQGGNFGTATEGFITNYTYSGNDEEGYTFVVQFGQAYAYAFKDTALGDYANLAFSMYVYNCFDFNESENAYMENVTIHTTAGMGVVGRRTTNIYANRVNIAIPKDSGRLMTVTADGMHFAECYGDVKVTNSIIEYTHDDALNIKSGYYYTLTGVSIQNKTLTIAKKTEGISMPEVGNVIEFYDGNNFEKKGYGTVESVTGTESSYVVKVKESLIKQNAGNWGNNVVATNISKTAKFTFENNIVRNKRNRGLLIQVRDASIKNNSFFNVGHGTISIHSSLDQFNEATMPKSITIENNKFVNNNYLLSLAGDISVFARATALGPVGAITDITIKNNFISRNGNAGVSLQACSDSVIEDNLFHNNGRVTTGEVYECAVELNNASDIVINSNYAYNTNDSETYAGIITNGLTSTETITLTDNINLSYQVIIADVSTTEVSKLASAVTLDGNITEWADMGTSVGMNGHSIATGVAIDPNEYADVFGIKMCKIGWTNEGIYIAFDVKDNKFDFKTQNNFWNGDCFELFISNVTNMPNADFQLYKNNGDVAQFGVSPTWSNINFFTLAAVRTNEEIVAAKNDITVKCVTTDEGYAGEMFLPFTVFAGLEQTITDGEEIAIAFVFADNDRDDLGRKRVQVSNVPHFVEAWKTKTAKMPLFKFVD